LHIKERVMMMLKMRTNPCRIDLAEDRPVVEAREDRALPRMLPATVGIVVTGDNHLSPALPGLTPQRRAQRRKRLRAAFSAAVIYALAHDARLFVIAGDLFDSLTPSAQDRDFVAAALGQLRRAGIPCVAIAGEHDLSRGGGGPDSPLAAYAADESMHLFVETNMLRPRLFELGGLKVAVAGLSRRPCATPGFDPLAGIAVEDDEQALDRADFGLLVVHAPIDGLAPAEERYHAIRRGNLAALPERFRVVAAGHVHRYMHKRIADRHVVVCGATERMGFDGDEGAAGFAWLELGPQGLVRATHIPIEEQPRADLIISTERLWPVSSTDGRERGQAIFDGEVAYRPLPTLEPALLLRLRLSEVCTEEAIVRVRLCGRLTGEQRRQLALAEMIAYGRGHAFSFELDTRGLSLLFPGGPQLGDSV
jgi:hypothetical protein